MDEADFVISEVNVKNSKKRRKKKNWVDYLLLVLMFWLLFVGIAILGRRLYFYLKEASLEKETTELTMGIDLPQETQDIESKLIDRLREAFKNPDIIAYLVVPDAGIEYPVVQGETNETYLHKNIYGQYTVYGSIFLDADCNPDFLDRASAIYGHHMIDKSMFGGLERTYRDSIDGKYFMVYTREKALRYEILCSTLTSAYGINPYIGDPGQNTSDFVDNLKARAKLWNSNLTYDESSRFTSLMTCHGDGQTHRYGITGILKENTFIKNDLEVGNEDIVK